MKTTVITLILLTVMILVLYVFSDIGKSINNYYFPRKDVYQYGKVVSFDKGEGQAYPDFTIFYKGEKTNRLGIPNNNKITRTVSVDEFIVCKHSTPAYVDCIEVEWSPGLGIVEPSMFKVQGQEYTILKDIGPMTILSPSGKVSWVIDKVK